MRNKRFGKLLSAALAAAMALSLSSAALAAGNGETHLTIIGTSDTHGNIWGYSYEDMKESTGDGLARVSAYVNQVRSENPNTILVDAGDTIQGTIMTDDLYSKDTASHPVAAALNYMDYDAWTLGNHEFNFGVDTLKSILEQVDMPVLAANIKNADGSYFTGAGYTIVERGGVKLNTMWNRRQTTKFNGVPYVVQRGAAAIYTPEGHAQVMESINYYKNNARVIREELTAAGLECFGGVNAPYIWLKTPGGMPSWDFFDLVLDKANVATTPGVGFGPSGEGFARLTAFGDAEDTKVAVGRIRAMLGK